MASINLKKDEALETPIVKILYFQIQLKLYKIRKLFLWTCFSNKNRFNEY